MTMENNKDMWVHESFATYSEVLYVESMYDYDAMLRYLNYQKTKILNPLFRDFLIDPDDARCTTANCIIFPIF